MDKEIKGVLPEKNSDDALEHELTYTRTLIDTLKEQEASVCIPKIEEKLNLLRETLDGIRGHYVVSEDEDARIGHKSEEDSFFGYKMHIGMTQERIMTAAVVASGEKGDGPQLPVLTRQGQKDGTDVQIVTGDSAYSGGDNPEKTCDEHFELIVKLNPNISQGSRKEGGKFDYNKDTDMFVRPIDYIAICSAKQERESGIWNQAYTYYFDVHKCQCCSKREGCYKPGAKSEIYSVPIKIGEQQQQIEFQQAERFKEKVVERYKIEAKNMELEQVYGYDKAQSHELSRIRMQGVVAIFATNLRRIPKFS